MRLTNKLQSLAWTWRDRRAPALAIASAAALFLQGCVPGISDPLVEGSDRPTPPATFTEAVIYANKTKDHYFLAMSNQARLSTWVGGGLIPLAAAASGLAFLGKTPSAIYLGLTGAGIWTTSLWFRNQPAQLAYLAGHEAVNCAVTAVVPFASVGRDEHAKAFDEALAGFDGKLAQLQQRIAELRAVAPADPLLAIAERQLGDAVIARDNGRTVQALARTLPDLLVSTVERIQVEVNRSVILGQPDLASLDQLIGALGGAYGQFGQVPTIGLQPQAKPAPRAILPEMSPRQMEADRRRDALEAAMAEVGASHAIIAAAVNSVGSLVPVDAMARCGVDPEQVTAALSVVPPGPYLLPAKAAGQQGFVVGGGTAPYAAQVAGGTPGITVAPVELFGAAFLIKTEASVAEGHYPILVRDITGRQRFVELRIGNDPSVEPQRTASEQANAGRLCAETAANPIAACASRETIARLQRALCVPLLDGRWGPDSQRAFEAYQVRVLQRDPPQARMTEALRDELLARTDAEIDAPEVCGPRDLIDALDGLQRALLLKSIEIGGVTYNVVDAGLRPDRAAGKLRVPLCREAEATTPPSADAIRTALFEKAAFRSPVLDATSLVLVDGNDAEIAPDSIALCS